MKQEAAVMDKINAALAKIKQPPQEHCVTCGKSFEVVQDAQYYCSDLCRAQRYVRKPEEAMP